MLVDPAARGRGVARTLVAFAVGLAGAAGKILEAYPARFAPGPEDAWRGPLALFLDLGFAPLEPLPAAEDPLGLAAPTHAYPVLRLSPNGVQRPPPLG
jgi:GNAT superfamily N-acetyltransferase